MTINVEEREFKYLNKKIWYISSLILFLIMFVTGIYFFVFLILSIISVLIGSFIGTHNLNVRKEHIKYDSNTKVKELDIDYDDLLLNIDGTKILLISDKDSSLYLLRRNSIGDLYNFKRVRFDELFEVGIIEDGETLTSTSKVGLVGGSLLGGLIAGGFGAVIGAIGTDKTSINQVKKLTLTIVIDELKNPKFDIVLLDLKKPVIKNHFMYKDAFEKCDLWNNRMSVIIKRNENIINK